MQFHAQSRVIGRRLWPFLPHVGQCAAAEYVGLEADRRRPGFPAFTSVRVLPSTASIRHGLYATSVRERIDPDLVTAWLQRALRQWLRNKF
jgi:hypothetical protein